MHHAVAEAVDSCQPLGDHLIGLPGSPWAFWRCVGLRSAGFPANTISILAASESLIEASNAVLAADAAVAAAKAKALHEVNGELDQLRRLGQWEEKERRLPLVNALQKLKMDQVPPLPMAMAGSQVLEDFRRAKQEAAGRLETYRRVFSQSSMETSKALRQIAAWPQFREAVTWQSRRAVTTALDTLLSHPPHAGPPTSKSRQDEELVASYLQRYCVKNDTIGFFGPVGWAQFAELPTTLVARPGDRLLATRQVYFELWPIEALAKAILSTFDIRRWLNPIRMPFLRVEGLLLHHPVYGSSRISREQAEILRACDGRMPAIRIAAALKRDGVLRQEEQLYERLAELASAGLVFWDFNIPLGPYPERVLRRHLERIEDCHLRRNALNMLDELEDASYGVAAAAGNAEELGRVLQNLEQTFARLTGVSPTRGEGKVYAGRTIVYEDCRRDVTVVLGSELLEALATPLSLLLTSARWLTSECAAVHRNKFREIYREMANANGNAQVDAATFFQKISPFLYSDGNSLERPVQERFQAKWERILGMGDRSEPLQYSSHDLVASVRHEFGASRPGWRTARYHSPDIMIVAADLQAVERGDYLLTMGEFHVGVNTLQAGLFVNQHPSPEDLIEASEADLGTPRVVALPSRDTPELLARTFTGMLSSNDFRLEYAKDGFVDDRSKAIQISSLVVVEEDGMLVARTRDGRRRFDLIDLVGGLLQSFVIDSFRMIGARIHTPRISIDRLVIKRESWKFPVEALTFAGVKLQSDRFLETRRWAAGCRLPRMIFFKAPVERKPMFVDLDSPILVDLFCKAIRRTREAGLDDPSVEISEMLPTPDQVWLRDAAGNRYTSEFRVVAVDLCLSPELV